MFDLQHYSLNACDHLTSQSECDLLLQAAPNTRDDMTNHTSENLDSDFGAVEWLVSQQVMFWNLK